MVNRISLTLALALILGGLSAAPLRAQTPVALQNATADFSQTGFAVGNSIDGNAAGNLGWAVDPQEGFSHTAAFETVSNVGGVGGSVLTFTLTQNYSFNPQHLLGKFRLSLTTDDRSTFADGLSTGGDVTASWTVLTPTTATAANGSSLSILGDGSVLSSGALPNTDIYTITAFTALTNITGVRLEALTDPSLPSNGPGRQPFNGNFVLSEFGVGITPAATPEPGSLALATAMFLIGTGLVARRRKSRKSA